MRTRSSGQYRFIPPLMLLLGLSLTLLTFQRIQTSDEDAVRANREAGAAQLGLLIQSLAGSYQTDLTSTVSVALVTNGDPATYQARTEDDSGGDRALVSLRPELTAVPAEPTPEGEAAAASILATIEDQGIRSQLDALAAAGQFRFVLLNAGGQKRSLLLAAGASNADHAYVEVRRFALGDAGPAIVNLVDGIDTFAVYASDHADPAAAILASTDDLPLSGTVATTTASIGGQDLLIEVQGSADGVIPPVAVLAIGVLMSIVLAALLFVSQRRRNRAVEALDAAREANEARSRMEADLQQAQRMEAVGQLAGGIAHDFNNLLAAITSTVELVAEDVTDPRTQEDLDEIKNAARRGAALTRRLLSFSRRDVEAREILDLNQTIEDVEPLLRRSVTEDVTLDLDLQPGSIPVLGDAGEIEQILLNLVVNARDAGDGRDDGITVSTSVSERWARLSVHDTGTGMTPEVINRAFEPFFSTKAKSGGTGLGLAIVYGIVTRMGGEVHIDSEPGRGTTVTVSVPCDTSGITPPEVTVDHGPASTAVPTGESILLVEDEPTVRRATRRLLERAGHHVVDVGDGIEAIAVVEDGFDPTVVLTDVVLPGSLNGRDLASRILQMTPTARVVFASGYPSEIITRRQLLDEGAQFIAKPFSSEALLNAIRGEHGERIGARA